MSNALYTCKECKNPVVLSPSLSQRTGADGRTMSREEALCIFRDGRGGMCTACYIKHRSQQSVDLMRKHSLQYERVQVIHIA